MNNLIEQQLAQRASQGDQDALVKLLEYFQLRVYNICLRMLSNRDDAAETTQETLLKVIKNIQNFQAKSAIATWIIRIAINESTTQLRRRKIRQTTSLDAQITFNSTTGQSVKLQDQISNQRELLPEQRVQQNELHQLLGQALEQLDDSFRSILILRDMQDMNYQEIADILNIPVGTTKSRLFRARLALRQKMSTQTNNTPYNHK